MPREALLDVQDLKVEFWTDARARSTRSTASRSTSPPGETLGIVGESGCGKSVTSLALLGILARAGTRHLPERRNFENQRPAEAVGRRAARNPRTGDRR